MSFFSLIKSIFTDIIFSLTKSFPVYKNGFHVLIHSAGSNTWKRHCCDTRFVMCVHGHLQSFFKAAQGLWLVWEEELLLSSLASLTVILRFLTLVLWFFWSLVP
jgi:hypothetical protein